MKEALAKGEGVRATDLGRASKNQATAQYYYELVYTDE